MASLCHPATDVPSLTRAGVPTILTGMMSILLDALYALGLVIASPLWLYRMIRHGRYRSDLGQRFGAAPVRYSLQPVIWVHGVSLGEINAARSLVAEIHRVLPDYRVAVSSTTETGMAAARKLFAPDHLVFHWPLDFSFAVRRALRRLRPDLVVLMEGEVWPNFLVACTRRRIPVVVVNARMSADKGYPRYKRIAPLARRLLFKRLTAVGVQDESYAQRFIELGVDKEKVHLTGMLKYDSAEVADRIDGQEKLAAAVGLQEGQKLIVAGGTGEGEEKAVLEVFRELQKSHGDARLAIVPRKPERFDEVARLIDACGFAVIRRSQRPNGGAQPGAALPRSQPGKAAPPVILGDTMGDLRKFYALAACVFVGRSLAPQGGSDMIEAAALGKPTAFGPHTFNFPQADDLARHGCVRVADAAELTGQLKAWLSDPSAAAQAGAEAQRFVCGQQGATRRNVEMISHVLGRRPPLAEGSIATDMIRDPQRRQG